MKNEKKKYLKESTRVKKFSWVEFQTQKRMKREALKNRWLHRNEWKKNRKSREKPWRILILLITHKITHLIIDHTQQLSSRKQNLPSNLPIEWMILSISQATNHSRRLRLSSPLQAKLLSGVHSDSASSSMTFIDFHHTISKETGPMSVLNVYIFSSVTDKIMSS